MSEVKVNKISPRTACGTTTLGDSGDTINIPAGVTISNNGTATGFGATGAVNWDVASIKTVDFSAVAGVGYFVDTATTGAVEVTLPAAPAVGDVIGVSDYANNFNTANCTLNRNGLKIGGQTLNGTLTVDGVAVTLVYVDVTKGWIVTDSGNQTDAEASPKYVTATGGCISTCGNYKIHKFLSPGTLVVSCAGNPSGSATVDYLVVAGGGAGGRGATDSGNAGGGGGAGGYRESPGAASGCYTVSPLGTSPATALSVSATPYPITVGGGGTKAPFPAPASTGSPSASGDGSNSIFSTITSEGGGGGGNRSSPTPQAGAPGGSGGGAVSVAAGGTGNTPATPVAQGFPGGTNPAGSSSAGGGGATSAGSNGSQPGGPGGPGGDGATTSISFSPVTYSGGGGGGGGGSDPGTTGANGGSGIVIIRYKYQ